MLISTSRKPSSKTRAFCKNLSHALDCDYINRGKMSMRELQLKSAETGCDSIALVYEMKGNPSKITFFSNNGEELLVIIGSVSTTNQRLHIKTAELSFGSDIPELDILKDIFPISKSDNNSRKNHIYVEKLEDDFNKGLNDFDKRVAIIHFYNRDGEDTGLKINIRKIVKQFRGFNISNDSFNALNSVNSEITIDLEDEKLAKIVYDSVSLEFKTSPDYRSNMTLELKNSKLIINIESEDATSFRASINSAIKWIILSVEVADLTE